MQQTSLIRFIRALAVIMLHAGTIWAALAAAQDAHAQCEGPPIWVADRDCSVTGCTAPTLDGALDPKAYADGLTIPLQRFTDATRPNGTPLPDGSFSYVLDGDTLHMHIEVEGDLSNSCVFEEPDGTITQALQHRLDILLDLDPACGAVSDTSRRITFTFDSFNAPPVDIELEQFIGSSGAWSKLGPNDQKRFPVSRSIVPTLSEDGEDVRRFSVELAIKLKTEADDQAGRPSVIRAGDGFRLGLGFNDQDDQCVLDFDALYPRRTVDIGDFFTDSSQWARVALEVPQTEFEIMSYNVAQGPMPVGLGDRDGGTAEPMELGFVAAHVDHVCMQETWFPNEREDIIDATNMVLAMVDSEVSSIGRPKNKDAFEDATEDFVAGLTEDSVFFTTVTLGLLGLPLEPLSFQVFGGFAAATVGDEFGAGANGEDNGLLLMTQGETIREAVLEFPGDVCAGEDCLEDKGFNYVRVRPVDSPATDASEFVDLFCTHLQNTGTAIASWIPGAGGEPVFGDDPNGARNEQLERLKTAIDSLAASDRRAILAGDTNFNANQQPTYDTFRDILGLRKLATFEDRNNFLSDRYDLGVRNGARTVDFDINPFFAGPEPRFTGFGTSLEGACHETTPRGTTDDRSNRIDFILPLPTPSERPKFGVVEESFEIFPFFPGASMNVDDPNGSTRVPEEGSALASNVTVPPYEGVATHDGSCLSDHAAVVANIGLVRLRNDPVMNPFRDHRFDFLVSKIETNSGDCTFCGDPDMFGTLTHSTNGNVVAEQDFGTLDDSKVINDAASTSWCQPALATTPSPDVQILELDVDEEDSTSKTDHFDVSPVTSGKDEADHAFYRFEDGTTLFLSDSENALVKPQCDFMEATAGRACTWTEKGVSSDEEKATVTYDLAYEEVDECPQIPDLG